MKRGMFIGLEGGEGSGKTSILTYLRTTLQTIYGASKIDFTREPGGTIISEKIREILLDKDHEEMNKLTEVYLYVASRAQHVAQRVMPNLKNGITVITDRFIDTNISYQGYARGIRPEIVYQMNLLAVKDAIPDLTVFIDVHPSVALTRRLNSGNVDRLDSELMSFHIDAYNGYRHLYGITQDDYILNKKDKSLDYAFNPFVKKHLYHDKDVLVICGNQPLENVIADVDINLRKAIDNWVPRGG